MLGFQIVGLPSLSCFAKSNSTTVNRSITLQACVVLASAALVWFAVQPYDCARTLAHRVRNDELKVYLVRILEELFR